MNEIRAFENEQFGEVRTITKGEELWFVAADVCRILELADTHKAVSRLDDDEKGRNSIPTPGIHTNHSINGGLHGEYFYLQKH